MATVLQQIEDWLRGLLVSGIMDSLGGVFDALNQQVGEVAAEVGSTPAAFSPGVFSMIRSVSDSVILPIAGMILTFVCCYELIQMIVSMKGNENVQLLNMIDKRDLWDLMEDDEAAYYEELISDQKQQVADAKAEPEKLAEELKETETAAQDTEKKRRKAKQILQRPEILGLLKRPVRVSFS